MYKMPDFQIFFDQFQAKIEILVEYIILDPNKTAIGLKQVPNTF